MAELEDFEAFLEDSFDPIRFAGSLLQATNVVDDTELDLTTPLKKLQFDVNECNKRMESLVSVHHNQLLQNVDKVEVNKQLVSEIITPSAVRLRAAFERINKDVISPYDDAVKLNNALSKVHKTSSLLRGACFFLAFLQQLSDCEKSLGLSEHNREVIRLARIYRQISAFFTRSVTNAKFPTTDLLSIKIIRDYNPLFQIKCAEFSKDLGSKISSDMGHHSTFSASNSTLQNNILALYTIDARELFSVIEKGAMSKSIQIALAQLTRSLQSPRTLASAFEEVKRGALSFSVTLSDIFRNCKVASDELDQNESLLDAFLLTVVDDGSSLEHVYWNRLSYKFKKSVAATMARGGPIARNLRSQYSVLVEAADHALEDVQASSIKDALNLIGR